MVIRNLTTDTRKRLERIIARLANGEEINLEERINLNKYSIHIPFIARKVSFALKKKRDD